MSTKEKLEDLFSRFLNNECSEEETEWLMKEFNTGDNKRLLEGLVRRQLESFSGINSHATAVEKVYAKLSEYIQASGHQQQTGKTYLLWKKMAVAASVVLVLGAGGFWWVNNNNQEKSLSALKAEKLSSSKDFAPGGDKAILTLADGSTIILDSAKNGALTQQGNTNVLKLENGQLAYTASVIKAREMLYNTITTPRGGQYQVKLTDGTKVWLNAASSLKFPAAFTGHERRVEITGEAYFEVAHHAAMPFFVRKGEAEVKVLGTHFNVNAYDDETDITITLLEGRVNVSQLSHRHSQFLSPGQQASMKMDGLINVADDIDTEMVMAWKNGLFDFTSADIKTIMRQISRWYDIEVSYEGQLPEREFSGKISRNANASTVLKILEQSDIHFRMEDKKIVVTP